MGAGLLVAAGEDLRGYLHQVGARFRSVPSGVDPGQLIVRKSENLLEQYIGVRYQLHQAVLDTVVDHLHVVTGRVRSQIGDAGLAVRTGGDGLEEGPDGLVGLPRSSGHDAGTGPGPELAPGYTYPEEGDALGG